MRRLSVLMALITIAVAACQQKEQPAPQPQFPSGPVQAGPLQMQMQDDVKILQDAVRSDPKNVDVWIKLGNIFMDTSRFKEAIDAYQKALNIDPKNVDVRVDMGTCYRNIGRPDRAVEEYKKALKINPNHVLVHKNLGVVLAFDLNDRVGAVKELEKYLELAPNDPDALSIRQEIARMKAAR